jgi:hypothetical protein
MMEIRVITWEETIQLLQSVLRPNKSHEHYHAMVVDFYRYIGFNSLVVD